MSPARVVCSAKRKFPRASDVEGSVASPPNGFALQPRGTHPEIPGQRRRARRSLAPQEFEGKAKFTIGPRRSAGACWAAKWYCHLSWTYAQSPIRSTDPPCDERG